MVFLVFGWASAATISPEFPVETAAASATTAEPPVATQTPSARTPNASSAQPEVLRPPPALPTLEPAVFLQRNLDVEPVRAPPRRQPYGAGPIQMVDPTPVDPEDTFDVPAPDFPGIFKGSDIQTGPCVSEGG